MDVVLTSMIIVSGIATYFFTLHAERRTIREIELPEIDVEDEGVDIVTKILKRSKSMMRYKNIVDSMVLLTYVKRHGECDIEKLVPKEDRVTVEFGQMYVSRFMTNPTKLISFLVGTIEIEMDSIRTGSFVPIQDAHELRKAIDSFYYKFDIV